MESQTAAQVMNTKMNFVLFIDDDEEDNLVHKEALVASKLKVRSECITESREALSYLKQCLVKADVPLSAIPDVIFIDLNMPLYNGLEVVEEFRKLPDPYFRKKCMKFVLMTGMLHTHMIDLVKLEFSDVIAAVVQKPVTAKFLNELKNNRQ